jgi:son of sevenless-like protein
MPENEEDKTIFQEMRQFALSLTNEEAPIPALANQLQKLIDRREQGGMKKIVVTTLGKDVPPPILPRSLKKVKFLDLDPLEVARQLTIIESKAYNKLEPVEFLRKAWSDKDSSNVAINVKAMFLMANQISGWVGRSILSEDQMKKRAKLITRFIEIADVSFLFLLISVFKGVFLEQKCRVLNNFNTLMAILSGLNASHVHRLKRTWEIVSAKSHQIFESLNVLMDTSKNRINYRETLHSINPPCVPFLGLYLTDLTFIEDGNRDFLQNPEGMINFAKRMKTSEVIREVQQYQNVPYLFTSVPELQDFLKESFIETVNESDLYNMSLNLEPRER